MDNFSTFKESTITEDRDLALDVLGVIKTYNGSSAVEIEDDYLVTMVPSRQQLLQIIDELPADLEWDVMVRKLRSDFDPETIKISTDDPDENTIDDFETVNDDDVVYDLIVYLYNTESEESLDEIKRIIKINAKGKRRIKMKCKQGFKFDGRKCVKIGGKELVNKRRAIRKSVRTKRAKGSGFQKRVARLRNRALRKRKGMGLR